MRSRHLGDAGDATLSETLDSCRAAAQDDPASVRDVVTEEGRR